MITNLLLPPATGGERSEGATGMGAIIIETRDFKDTPIPTFPRMAGEGVGR